MKTILLFIALTGFTAVGSYAQNKGCANKPKTVAVHHVKKAPVPTCFMLKKENFGIPGCTDVVYGSSHSYLGYYPTKTPAIPDEPAVKIAATHKINKVREGAVTTPYPVVQRAPIFKKVDDDAIPCYTYKQHNIVVTECPNDFYNVDEWPNNAPAAIDYNAGNTYMGYYPKVEDIKDPTKMENKSLEDKPKEGLNIPGDNLYFWDSYKTK